MMSEDGNQEREDDGMNAGSDDTHNCKMNEDCYCRNEDGAVNHVSN